MECHKFGGSQLHETSCFTVPPKSVPNNIGVSSREVPIVGARLLQGEPAKWPSKLDKPTDFAVMVNRRERLGGSATGRRTIIWYSPEVTQ